MLPWFVIDKSACVKALRPPATVKRMAPQYRGSEFPGAPTAKALIPQVHSPAQAHLWTTCGLGQVDPQPAALPGSQGASGAVHGTPTMATGTDRRWL